MKRLAAVGVVLLLAACGIQSESAPQRLDREAAPFSVFDPATPPPVAGEVQVQLWFLRDERLVPIQRAVPSPGTPAQVLDALFRGPTERERSLGLSSALTSTLALEEVEVEDRIAVVTLAGLDESTQLLPAVAQIVVTLDARPEVDGVRFRTGDGDVPVPRGDSSLTEAPVNRMSYGLLLGDPVQRTVPPPPVTPGPTTATPPG